MASSPPSIPDLEGKTWNSTFGALLVGGLLSSALYGVTCAQTYVYYGRYQNDRWSLKLLVCVLWFLDTFDFIFNCNLLYLYLVTNYMNPLVLIKRPPWSLVLHVAVTVVTTFIIRSVFALRIWRFSGRNVFLAGLVMVSSLADLVIGLVITGKAFRLDSMVQLKSLAPLFYANFATSFFSDLFTALVLCFYLYRSHTGYHTSTDSVVTTLMLYAINTGLFTGIDACCGMITYITMPTNFVFITFYLSAGKLYINAYLASLNSRKALRQRADKTDPLQALSIPVSRPSSLTKDDSPPSELHLSKFPSAASMDRSPYDSPETPCAPPPPAIVVETRMREPVGLSDAEGMGRLNRMRSV